jgi:hypothetical protein
MAGFGRSSAGAPAGPRVLVVSQRDVVPGLAFSAWFEGEDVLVECSGADLRCLDRHPDHFVVRRHAGRVLRRLAGPARTVPARSSAAPPVGGYDLAVVVVHSIWDLPAIEALGALRRSADAVAVWAPEVWPHEVEHRRLRYEPLALADHLFVGEPRSAALLGSALARPVTFLPLATDTDRFAGADIDRPIHVLNIGRRQPALHDALIAWASEGDRWYVFDTLTSPRATNVALHRWALAQQYRRSVVALNSYAKQGAVEPDRVRWVPSRTFDGLASGALLAGHPPDPASQRALFGREVVHPLPTDPEGAVHAIEALLGRDGRAERVANVCTALEAHDWAHRWQSLLEAVGLPTPSGLRHRLDRLAATAEAVRVHGGRPATMSSVESA